MGRIDSEGPSSGEATEILEIHPESPRFKPAAPRFVDEPNEAGYGPVVDG